MYLGELLLFLCDVFGVGVVTNGLDLLSEVDLLLLDLSAEGEDLLLTLLVEAFVIGFLELDCTSKIQKIEIWADFYQN